MRRQSSALLAAAGSNDRQATSMEQLLAREDSRGMESVTVGKESGAQATATRVQSSSSSGCSNGTAGQDCFVLQECSSGS
jgi:hypothetical protein